MNAQASLLCLCELTVWLFLFCVPHQLSFSLAICAGVGEAELGQQVTPGSARSDGEGPACWETPCSLIHRYGFPSSSGGTAGGRNLLQEEKGVKGYGSVEFDL